MARRADREDYRGCAVTNRDRREAIDQANATARDALGTVDGLRAIRLLLGQMATATAAPLAERWRCAARLTVLIDAEAAAFEREPFGRQLRYVVSCFREEI